MKFVTRAQWGARPRKYINHGSLVAQSTCHWEGPKMTVGGSTVWSHDKCASLVRGIQNFHMDTRGWSDIAYNFVECPHGYTFEGRGINVINGANGTNLGNQTSHAVSCLAGEGNPFPMTEKIGFRECIEHIVSQAKCKPGCQGHRDHKSTACPGDARYNWVHAGMPVDQPAPPAPTPPVEEKDDMPAGFLLKLSAKSSVIVQVSSAREVHWVRDTAARKGYGLQNKLDGGNDQVCTLDSAEIADDPNMVNYRKMILNLPFVGEFPPGYEDVWVGPHIT